MAENGLHRAFANTGFAINALFGMNVNHVGILIKAVAGTDGQATFIFATLAWFCNDHRHHGAPYAKIG
jgi:hypothetical protein